MSAGNTALTAAPGSASDPGERIGALDGLRGLAVIGIVPMNVIGFAMPPAAYLNPRAFGGDAPLETALWAISFLVIEDKFRGLFAMMFGAGVAILLGKAADHRLRDHYARMAALLGIALAHAVVLANNDVLRTYAIAGLFLPIVMGWKVRWLVWASAAIMAGQLLVSGWFAWEWIIYWFDRASGALVDSAAHDIAEKLYGHDRDAIAAAIERNGVGLGERIVQRLDELPQQARFVAASLPSSFAAMVLGVALWRSGLLAGRWEATRAFRLARLCAGCALPVLASLAVWAIASGFDPIVTTANALVWSAPFDLVLSVGIAALAMALFGNALQDRPLTARLAATGRMALTNYLATSLLFSALFAGWGLDWFAAVSRGEALVLCLVPISLMLVWSPLWLARFRQGPAEWLWRSSASGRLLPFRRRQRL
ncbi:hypothetical protein CP97_03305 [Aurantiacibacter atlanticus]|uniref:DUF418 domain-containing protein n=1 Tax=Aurantiacibacter atlanticus TaxID=1648404 RepID=A0A0H4W0S6_9SPHN|nr:DUF418 domain-containing protein [Aurantiacibacter atlanticus]AKQ43118.2 hypothetical protein CP97_03305 [Aurantiacibacter atlanticus]MDF1835532.1 DUF418 domain-containing protein [Alteraurantiacibacter sp. bin_em_oilr2.035]